MDENCKNCRCLCKRLDTDDVPAHYYFPKLTPADVIDLIETISTEYNYWNLQVQGHQQSFGPQLALWFKPTRPSSRLLDVLVIAQASSTSTGTDLWLKYAVPEECCEDEAVARELSNMVQYALDVLHRTDSILANRPAPG